MGQPQKSKKSRKRVKEFFADEAAGFQKLPPKALRVNNTSRAAGRNFGRKK
jgi:hypothetical protein